MKSKDFSYFLKKFLSNYLPEERGLSINTIESYKYTFILLLRYLKEVENISANKISFKKIKRTEIIGFLNWLEEKRNCTIQTRNVRLAAIHSFYKYIQYESPKEILMCQEILSIPLKKSESRELNYMSIDAITELLKLPDIHKRNGRRDLALISLLYNTAARVQEIIDLTPDNVRFEKPYTIRLKGKGKKIRVVPIMVKQFNILLKYMQENDLDKPSNNRKPLFFNKSGSKLSRAGVSYILGKYVDQLREKKPQIVPDKFSCHCLRHSKSMHMLEAGVNLIYIRDILGHQSVITTEIYARTDSKKKREAIEENYINLVPEIENPKWETNTNLLNWLNNFSK